MSQPLPAQPDSETDGDSGGTPGVLRGKGWLATIMPVVIVAACAEMGIGVLNNSALPVYFKFGLKINETLLPLLMAPFLVSEALFKSPLGVLSDRYGRKPLMLFGTLVTVFTPIVLISLHYRPHSAMAIGVLVGIGFLRLLDGLGGAALWPALYAYVGDVVEERRRGSAMSLLITVYQLCLALAFLVGGFVDDTFGPILTGDITFGNQMRAVGVRVGHHLRQAGHHMVEHLHAHSHTAAAAVVPALPPPAPTSPSFFHAAHYYPSFYLTSLLFAIAAIAVLIGLRGHTAPGKATEHAEEHRITWANFVAALRAVPEYLGLTFLTFLGIGCIAIWVKIFAMQEFHLTEKAVGVLILGPAVVIAALAIPAGHLADRWGKTRAVRLGFVLCALGLWGIPWLHHYFRHEPAFVLSASLTGLGFVTAFPAWMALLTSLGGERQRGTLMGAVQTAQAVGASVGFLISGLLYHHLGPIAPFVAAAALVSCGAILAFFFVREPASSPPPAAA